MKRYQAFKQAREDVAPVFLGDYADKGFVMEGLLVLAEIEHDEPVVRTPWGYEVKGEADYWVVDTMANADRFEVSDWSNVDLSDLPPVEFTTSITDWSSGGKKEEPVKPDTELLLDAVERLLDSEEFESPLREREMERAIGNLETLYFLMRGQNGSC